MSRLAVIVDGQEITGWQRASVRRSIDELAPSFSVEVAAERGDALEAAGLFYPGQAAVIAVDGAPVITGWIDEVVDEEDGRGSRVELMGRARTCDLVDCSTLARTSWRKATPLRIAADLCTPHAIAVESDVDELREAVPHFRTQVGEPVFDALDRLCRDHGVRMLTTASGDLELVRTGQRRSSGSIARGVNVLRTQVRRSQAERFSRYVFRTQLAASDELNGEAAASVEYAVSDDGVERYRPMVVQDDAQGGRKALERRARWERNVRAGRSTSLRYAVRPVVGDVDAWYAAPGELWAPNTLVPVEDERHGVSGVFLLASVDLRLEEGSATVAECELVPPGAYTIQANPPRARGKARDW